MPDPFDPFPSVSSARSLEEVERTVALEREENKRTGRIFEDLARIDARKREQAEERAGFAWTMFKVLREQVAAFERTLAPEEETAAWLANFGANVTLVITEIAYRDPHLIILRGEDQDGRPRELLQHVSQVSLLLAAIPAKPDRPGRRIGFLAEEH
jgi:hypothetical protein